MRYFPSFLLILVAVELSSLSFSMGAELPSPSSTSTESNLNSPETSSHAGASGKELIEKNEVEKDQASEKVKLCFSTQEFILTYEFLRSHGTAALDKEAARQISIQVARGCDGAAERFKETYLFLTKIGVAQIKAFEMGIEFSRLGAEVQRNFIEILKHSYLGEFFDYDFDFALKVAYEFSKNLGTHHLRARRDFISMVSFCLKKDEMALPINVCGILALELVRLSPYYSQGVFTPFTDLYGKLRAGESFGLSVRDAMEVILRVLKFGPRSPANFNRAYEYAVNTKGLSLAPKQALAFALGMSKISATGMPLPIAKSEAELAQEKFERKR